MKNCTMKTKHFLAAMLTFMMMVTVFVQAQPAMHDNPNTVVPGHPGIVLPSGGYITTTDNEDNGGSGNPDGDMDTYIFYGDGRLPIDFNIFVDDAVITSAQLSILAFDVDWPQGEQDEVFINSHSLGYLTGVNDEWSTSVFTVNPSWIIPGPNGKNLIQIYMRTNWAVTVDWGQIITNGTTGSASFRYVNLDKTQYCSSQCIQATEEVDANPSLSVRVETKLLDPSNGAIVQKTRTFTATTGDEPFTESLCLPAVPTPGTWHIQAICYDATTNVQMDIKTIPIEVTENCNIPTMSQWGLIILAAALLGVGTVYIMRRRSSNAAV
jgi:hypothetical protein